MKIKRKRLAGNSICTILNVWFSFLAGILACNILWLNEYNNKVLQYIGLSSKYLPAKDVTEIINLSMGKGDDYIYSEGKKALELAGYSKSFFYITSEKINWSVFIVPVIFLLVGLLFVFVSRKNFKNYERQVSKLTDWAHRENNEKADFSMVDEKIIASIEDLKYRISRHELLHREDNARLLKYLEDISHQLKTPLSVIRAICERTSTTFADAREYMDNSILQVDKMSELIRQLLLLGRFECGKVKAEYKTISPQIFFETLANDYYFILEKEKIELIIDCDSSEKWICDEFWMRQAIDNIISNSIRHAKEEGKIEIKFRESETQYTIEIRDDGVGFENGTELLAFDRFSSKDRTGCEGAGLGLPIAKQAVELHFGTIEAHNHKTGGAKFYIELPKLDGDTLLNNHIKVTSM